MQMIRLCSSIISVTWWNKLEKHERRLINWLSPREHFATNLRSNKPLIPIRQVGCQQGKEGREGKSHWGGKGSSYFECCVEEEGVTHLEKRDNVIWNILNYPARTLLKTSRHWKYQFSGVDGVGGQMTNLLSSLLPYYTRASMTCQWNGLRITGDESMPKKKRED